MQRPLRILCTLALMSALLAAHGDPVNGFAPLFTNGAVLQRDCTVPVWGTTERPGAAVRVAFDDIVRETRSDAKGAWKVAFDALGEPGSGHTLTLTVDNAEPIVLEDIAVGDVWICGGQDNMEMNFWSGVDNGDAELQECEYPDLRLFRVGHAATMRPAQTVKGSWSSAFRDSVVPFSACAYFFGQRLYLELGVPIGLVDVSRASTPAESWISLNALDKIPGRKQIAAARRAAVHDWEHGGAEALAKAQRDWDASKDGADPYEGADVLPWNPAFTETDWREVDMPSTFEAGFNSPAFDGIIWYRHTFELTVEQAAAPNPVLHLGAIDDNEATWLNGVKVGETKGASQSRDYALQGGVLKAGANTLVVWAQDTGGNGGFTGKPEHVRITFDSGDSVPLAGTWRAKGKGIPNGPRPVDPSGDQTLPAASFNGMIAPLFPLAVKGIVWYHGCSDVGQYTNYAATVKGIAECWRTGFTSAQKDAPFLLAQLSSVQHGHPKPVESDWAAMRWTQTQLALSLPNSAIANFIDFRSWDHRVHNKRLSGERIARLAMAVAYGDTTQEYMAPLPSKATLSEGKVVVSFTHADFLSTSDEKPPAGFQLAGEDGVFAWTPAAEIDGDTVVLDIPEGMTPTRVRFAWDDNPTVNLVGADNLPCGSFELPIFPAPTK